MLRQIVEEMLLMSQDNPVAVLTETSMHTLREELLPLYLRRTGNTQEWLSMRAVDAHRTNSRLLKKALRLSRKDDISTVLHFNAATITDTYWVKGTDSPLTYDDVRFRKNDFDTLALNGDVNAFNRAPSRSPELTNTGSFEKCWRLIDGRWWMYKAGTHEEHFTELFAYRLACALGIPAARYEADSDYVRTLDFTDGAAVNLETAYGIVGDEAEYPIMYDRILETAGASAAEAFVRMCYFDALIFNMDRHEHNFGVLRDVETGDILGLAPLFDHNIALIARGYPQDIERRHDRLITDFVELLRARQIRFALPELTPAMAEDVACRTPFRPKPDPRMAIAPEQFAAAFVLNGQERIREAIAHAL